MTVRLMGVRVRGLAWVVCVVGLTFTTHVKRTYPQPPSIALEKATTLDLNRAFSSGMLNSENLVQTFLSRIEAYDKTGPGINAIITLNPAALDRARELDIERSQTGPRSLLHGIPVLVKDNHDTLDMPTTAGSLSLKDSLPPDDAFIVQRLRDAGAIILGKTNLDEFSSAGLGLSSLGGQTRNPYDVARVPGGSSGGTAAAVASNFAVVGTGSDTAGSIREPAAVHGLIGLRPTLGLVSRDGMVPVSLPRDTAGPIARSVTDIAVTLDTIAGVDVADPLTSVSQDRIPASYTAFLNHDGLHNVRLGVARSFFGRVDRETVSLMEAAIDEMKSQGATVLDPFRWRDAPDPTSTWYNTFHHDMNNYLETLGPNAAQSSVTEIIASGDFLDSLRDFPFSDLTPDSPYEDNPGFVVAESARERARTSLLEQMDREGIDMVLYPSSATQAPPLIAENPNPFWPDVFLSDLAPALGFPAISLPIGFTTDGLPVGMELLGRPFSEPQLISAAFAFEQATSHWSLPASTPSLPGETITVPEPSVAVLLIGIGFCGLTVYRYSRQGRSFAGSHRPRSLL